MLNTVLTFLGRFSTYVSYLWFLWKHLELLDALCAVIAEFPGTEDSEKLRLRTLVILDHGNAMAKMTGNNVDDAIVAVAKVLVSSKLIWLPIYTVIKKMDKDSNVNALAFELFDSLETTGLNAELAKMPFFGDGELSDSGTDTGATESEPKSAVVILTAIGVILQVAKFIKDLKK